jgi:molybdopterin-guanine dinucleotide biosynthesis protein A
LKKLHDDITAFILSGGKSSRMGTNKAFLDIDGKSLIERMLELLDPIFSEVAISSNEPELYNFLGKKIIKDFYPGRGPLAGIHSVLNSTTSQWNFIISCDMPFISKELIVHLTDYKTDLKILLPKADGRIQPLCGIYSKSVLPDIEKLLIESSNPQSSLKGSVYESITYIQPEIIDVTKTNLYHSDLFLNINTHEDYNYAKSIFDKK